jgi:tetratricopeptide (TPR) repeat protein
MHSVAIVLACVWLSAACQPVRLQAAPGDWQSRLRQFVEQQELASALAMAEDRLSEHPEDLEARGWRARLLAWTNRWNESEIEYQAVLESAPYDTDILVGLADLLSWQGRRAEAIAFLDRASTLDAGRKDVQLRRGRLLHALGLRAEAGTAYAQLLSLKGLFVGMEAELATPATEFLHRPYEGRAASLVQVPICWSWICTSDSDPDRQLR